jgi:hypothetical protein
MRLLLLANHFATCSARYYADAFARLGHDVRHIGPSMGAHIWGITVPARHIWTPCPPEPGWTPDLVIVADSDPSILEAARDLPCTAPKIVVAVDNHVRSYVRPHFDHYFLAHRHPAVSLQAFTDNTTWLPCAHDPVHFYAKPDDYRARPYDCALVGVPYPQRIAVVTALRAAGLSVYAAAGLLYDDYANAYWNARLSICVSIAGDVAQRIFETAALGCAVISDPCPDLPHLDPQGITVLDSRHPAAYVAAAQHLLAHPETALSHIAASTAWSRAHTWDIRASTLLAHLS